MDLWGHSSFTEKIALRLIEDGLLRLVTNAAQPEWIVSQQ
jgi:sulfur relay (sulfurtransferase) DsrF/TusC family protein